MLPSNREVGHGLIDSILRVRAHCGSSQFWAKLRDENQSCLAVAIKGKEVYLAQSIVASN